MKSKKRRSRPPRLVLLDVRELKTLEPIRQELAQSLALLRDQVIGLAQEVTRLQLENEARSSRARKANATRRSAPTAEHLDQVTLIDDHDNEVLVGGNGRDDNENI